MAQFPNAGTELLFACLNATVDSRTVKSCFSSRFSLGDLKVQTANILPAPAIKSELGHQMPGPVDIATALRPPLKALPISANP